MTTVEHLLTADDSILPIIKTYEHFAKLASAVGAYIAARLHCCSQFLGGSDEGIHRRLGRALENAVPEVEDVLARAAGLGDIGAHSLPDLLRASEEDGRVDVPLDLCLF